VPVRAGPLLAATVKLTVPLAWGFDSSIVPEVNTTNRPPALGMAPSVLRSVCWVPSVFELTRTVCPGQRGELATMNTDPVASDDAPVLSAARNVKVS
jgi:hypothetical protein